MAQVSTPRMCSSTARSMRITSPSSRQSSSWSSLVAFGPIALEIDDASEYASTKFSRLSPSASTEFTTSRGPKNLRQRVAAVQYAAGTWMFLAAKRFGVGRQKQKICLILDSMPYRYQQFMSDIAGQDIQVHNNSPKEAISVVRNWLRDNASGSNSCLVHGNLPPT